MAAPVSLLTAPLTPVNEALAMEELGVDLGFLFDQNKVPRDIQAKVAELGYTDAAIFAEIGGTAERVRETVTDVGINPETGAQHRAVLARLMAVWRAAQKRSELQQTREAGPSRGTSNCT